MIKKYTRATKYDYGRNSWVMSDIRKKPINPRVLKSIENNDSISVVSYLSDNDFDYLTGEKREFVKTVLLAITIFFLYFMILNTIYYLFHVDYRFVFLGVRIFRPITLVLIPMYVPLFFIFFLSNSIRVNSAMRFKNNKSLKNIFLSAFATCSGLILILIIQYLTLWITGRVFWTKGWLFVNLLFAVVPIMFILPFFQRHFFLLTGKVYLGAITMSLIFIMILLSNTVCYFPL